MEYFVVLLVVGIAFGGISAAIANSRGASTGLAFLAGLLLGPIGLLVAFLMERTTPASAVGDAGTVEPVPSRAGDKTCPRCAETIKAAAHVCRYCGHEFAEAEVAASVAESTPLPPAMIEPPSPAFAAVDQGGEGKLIVALGAVLVAIVLVIVVGSWAVGSAPYATSSPITSGQAEAELLADNIEAMADNLEAMAADVESPTYRELVNSAMNGGMMSSDTPPDEPLPAPEPEPTVDEANATPELDV